MINFSYEDVCALMGKDVPVDEFLRRVPLIGSDVGDNVPGRDEMSVEFFPNRPDMYSVEGIARGMRAFLGIEPGLRRYETGDSGVRAVIADDVREICPYFMCAVVRDVRMTDAVIRSMIEMQEKLHVTVGRKRAKLAIGIHDLDRVTPPFTFRAVDPEGIRFVPLAMDEPLSPREVLERSSKGREHAHLVDGMGRFPVIVDAEGEVLSFPPITNGALTAVTADTRNLFIDVTGSDAKAVEGVVNIVATSLAERGGRICRVEMEGAPKSSYPNLEPTERRISLGACGRFIGRKLTPDKAIECLGRMGMDGKIEGDAITVLIPAYRLDIMHDVDVYEDIAIGYGFENYGGGLHPVVQTCGSLLPETSFSDSLRDVMVGLGYTELNTLTLSNRRDEFGISGLPEVDSVSVMNPITEEHASLRSHLMPSLMGILVRNKRRDLPQRVFEVGFVIRDGKAVLHLCALQAASKSSFTEAKSLTESVLREMGVDHSLEPCGYATFVPGRGAFVVSGGERIGIFGEMSPKTITSYGMTHPAIMLEIDLSGIIAGRSGKLVR